MSLSRAWNKFCGVPDRYHRTASLGPSGQFTQVTTNLDTGAVRQTTASVHSSIWLKPSVRNPYNF